MTTSRIQDRTVRGFFSLKFHDSLLPPIETQSGAPQGCDLDGLLKVFGGQAGVGGDRLAPDIASFFFPAGGFQCMSQVDHGATELRLVLQGYAIAIGGGGVIAGGLQQEAKIVLQLRRRTPQRAQRSEDIPGFAGVLLFDGNCRKTTQGIRVLGIFG